MASCESILLGANLLCDEQMTALVGARLEVVKAVNDGITNR
jgi:hypothetical protein